MFANLTGLKRKLSRSVEWSWLDKTYLVGEVDTGRPFLGFPTTATCRNFREWYVACSWNGFSPVRFECECVEASHGIFGASDVAFSSRCGCVELCVLHYLEQILFALWIP